MFQVLAFDRKGGRWRRGEHLVTDAGERLRVERMLRERIVMNPARFVTTVEVGGGVAVGVEWESVVRSVGIAYLGTGGERSVACLLFGGSDEVAEETTTRALQAELGVVPGHPLCPGFTTVLKERRRPLVAVFNIGEAAGPAEQALSTVEGALANVYFGIFGAAGEDAPGESASPVQ